MLLTSADSKVSTYLNKGCRDWSEVSEEPIRHLYTEMGKRLWEPVESAALSILSQPPHSQPISNTTADEDSARFLKMVSLYGHSRTSSFFLANDI